MTGGEFQKIAIKHLLPSLDGFGVKGRLLFAEPLEYFIRGFHCEPSAFSRQEFCIELFVQPLFVPEDSIVFSLGGRLGSIRGSQERWWTYSEAKEASIMRDVLHLMKREGPEVLDKFKTLQDFVQNAIDRRTNPHSPYPPEMVAYGAVLLGDTKLAHNMFDRLEGLLHPEQEYCEYHAEIRDRARSVREAFACDPREAVAILHRWREQTAANLKLTKFLAPLE